VALEALAEAVTVTVMVRLVLVQQTLARVAVVVGHMQMVEVALVALALLFYAIQIYILLQQQLLVHQP
jgi:hypothetical protein